MGESRRPSKPDEGSRGFGERSNAPKGIGFSTATYCARVASCRRGSPGPGAAGGTRPAVGRAAWQPRARRAAGFGQSPDWNRRAPLWGLAAVVGWRCERSRRHSHAGVGQLRTSRVSAVARRRCAGDAPAMRRRCAGDAPGPGVRRRPHGCVYAEFRFGRRGWVAGELWRGARDRNTGKLGELCDAHDRQSGIACDPRMGWRPVHVPMDSAAESSRRRRCRALFHASPVVAATGSCGPDTDNGRTALGCSGIRSRRPWRRISRSQPIEAGRGDRRCPGGSCEHR